MTTFEIHDPQSAPAGSRPLLEQVRAKYGFVPNVLGTLATSPTTLEGYLALSAALEQSTFSAPELQTLLLAISHENRCHYCVAAHSTIAAGADVPEPAIAALRAGTALDNPKLEALQRFARLMVRERGFVPQADVQAFLDAGYTKAQVLDVITAIAMKTISNYGNHLAETPVDDAFGGGGS